MNDQIILLTSLDSQNHREKGGGVDGETVK